MAKVKHKMSRQLNYSEYKYILANTGSTQKLGCMEMSDFKIKQEITKSDHIIIQVKHCMQTVAMMWYSYSQRCRKSIGS